MVKINLVEDVLVPGAVPLIDWIVSEKIPVGEVGKYADYTGLGMCLAGYGLSAFGIGGNYSKNIGIASLDWAVNAVRNLVKGAGVTRRVSQPASQRLVMRPASRVGMNPVRTQVGAIPTITQPVVRWPEEEIVRIITP